MYSVDYMHSIDNMCYSYMYTDYMYFVDRLD